MTAPADDVKAIFGKALELTAPAARAAYLDEACAGHPALRGEVEGLLQANRLRPVFLFDTVPTRFVETAELADVDPTFQSLRNLNEPADYEAALRERAAD